MDFTVAEDCGVKMKESENGDNYKYFVRVLKHKQSMEHESDGFTNCSWCTWDNWKKIVKRLETCK